jgi:hypothetical protein
LAKKGNFLVLYLAVFLLQEFQTIMLKLKSTIFHNTFIGSGI